MRSMHDLHAVAAAQHGLITRSTLLDLGWDARSVRALVRSGRLVAVGRRTMAVGGAPETDRRRVMAACLETGGVAFRSTAAWLHQLDGFAPGTRPSVVVSKGRGDYRTDLADVHASTWLPADDVVRIDGIPTLGVARTLFSLAATVPELPVDVVVDAVDTAVRDGKASDAWLWWLLERIRCRGRNGVSVFEGLLVERAGGRVTESWLEREFLAVLSAAGIAAPACQRRVARQGAFVARVDFAYEDLGIVIEISGHTSHSTRRQQATDARRRNQLALAGLTVVEFTYDDLVSDPAYVAGRVAELLAVTAARLAA